MKMKLKIPKPQTDYSMRHVELHVSCFCRPTTRYICQFMPLAQVGQQLPSTSAHIPVLFAPYTTSSREAAQIRD